MHFVSAFTILFLASQAVALKLKDCGSKHGKILEVSLTGCEDTDVCELKRGETYTYSLKFESLTESETLKAAVYGIVNGIAMPYPLPNSDACESDDIDCPIKSGEVYHFENEFEVQKSYPAMRVDVKWELKDDSNTNVVCGIVPVKIV